MATISRTTAAHLTTMRVSRNLEEAIANYELFAVTAKNAALITPVNTLTINAGFNAISAGLHHVVVITLCRIWDNSKNVASLWSIKKLLGNLVTEKIEMT